MSVSEVSIREEVSFQFIANQAMVAKATLGLRWGPCFVIRSLSHELFPFKSGSITMLQPELPSETMMRSHGKLRSYLIVKHLMVLRSLRMYATCVKLDSGRLRCGLEVFVFHHLQLTCIQKRTTGIYNTYSYSLIPLSHVGTCKYACTHVISPSKKSILFLYVHIYNCDTIEKSNTRWYTC